MIDAVIKELRIAKGLTQAELARQLNVTQQAVARWEKAITSPDYETLGKLANFFKVSTDFLLGRTGSPMSTLPYTDSKKIPLIGTIACGRPILAQENHETYVVAVDGMDTDFALRIKGESMAGDGLHDGYIIFVKQCDDVEDGEMAAVLVGNEATIKRIYRSKGTVTLISSNPAFPPLVYHTEDSLQMRVIGRPVGFQGKL